MANPPSIQLEGDHDRALALVPQARALLRRVQDLKTKMGVDVYAQTQRIDDDSTIYALSTLGLDILQITVNPQVIAPTNPKPLAPDAIAFPTFLSGLISPGLLTAEVKDPDTGKVTAPSMLNSYAPTQDTIKQYPVGKGPKPGFQTSSRLAISPNSDLGELKEPDGSFFKYSQYYKLKPSMYSGSMAACVQLLMGMGKLPVGMFTILQKARPDYAKLIKDTGVQIRYDYKFNRTHGLAFSPKGQPWLVEISQARGVVIAPLPIFPLSNGDFYRARAANAGNQPMVLALERLNCLPTGELPDMGNARVLLGPEKLEDFYANSAYSSAMGWAFNDRGDTAYNTGWHLDEASSVNKGETWKLSLSISDKDQQGNVQASALVSRVEVGNLFLPQSRLGKYMPIKFHDPLINGLLSQDISSPIFVNPEPSCDTTVFVCWNESILQTVKFFRDTRALNFDQTDDGTEGVDCLYNSSWTITEKSGTTALSSGPYTNQFDDRAVYSAITHVTTISSKDIGYDPPKFSDFITDINWSHMTRDKVFQVTTHLDSSTGEYSGSVVAIPAFSREAYYYAYSHGYTDHGTSTSVGYNRLTDPTSYYGWRRILAAPGHEGPDTCDYSQCGTTHSVRLVVCEDKEDYTCSEYADGGSWASQCDNIEALCSNKAPVRNGTSTSQSLGADQTASLKLQANTGFTTIELPLTPERYTIWTIPSPDPDTGIVQYIAASYSSLGDAGMVYMNDLGGAALDAGTMPVQVKSTLTSFIGVNAS